MSPNVSPQPTQSTPAPDMPVPTKEDIIQAKVQKALARVLSKLSAPQPADLRIHANERVMKELTKNLPSELWKTVLPSPVTEPMTPEERKALAYTLTWQLDQFLENQVLYEPDTSVTLRDDDEYQAESTRDLGGQRVVAVKKHRITNQLLTVGEACRRLGLRRHPVTHLPLVDPGDSSGVQPFSLRPWQATGI